MPGLYIGWFIYTHAFVPRHEFSARMDVKADDREWEFKGGAQMVVNSFEN